ncbi:HAD family hydrolase [Promethearchaeum syntrophicum]|uniref:HAD family hydrolase n=1 Tax=Promethearchaeum syntrophicum TaxID=2594042 RepID=A0A5B9DES0_9ARCH|nr:HAD family hydrolase [Candidatus Prometheoarchaeum syntrophicum]QEE17614.1 putative HAD-hydrolase [Candidatus Prometheoarchaeum syntrophicum]
MRDFFCFDLGETLINFNKPNKKWHSSLIGEVLPDMFMTLNKISQGFKDICTVEEFSTIGYKIISTNRKLSMIKRLSLILDNYNIPIKMDLINLLLADFYHNLISTATLYPESIKILKKLQNKGYVLGLWSNTPWESPGFMFEKIMKHFEIRRYFSVVLFSGDYGIRKPDPLTFDLVLKKAQVDKSRMIYIGNAEVDIKTGSNFGIPTIWVNRDQKKLSENVPTPEFIIKDLEGIFDLLPIS